MKITVESTTKTVLFNGVPARLWEGKTDSGITVHAFITRIAVQDDCDRSQLDRELETCVTPSPEFGAYFPDGINLNLLGGN